MPTVLRAHDDATVAHGRVAGRAVVAVQETRRTRSGVRAPCGILHHVPSVTWALGIACLLGEVAHDAQHLVLGQALHGMGALAAQRAVQRAVLRGGALDARGAEAVLTLERDGVAHQLEADGALQLIRHRRVGKGESLHGNVGQCD
eukprot:scaffold12931_cov66-Phaeocystis_antarctica.AAC.2